MSDLIGSTVLTPRFQSRMLLIFSVLALALAIIGIYAVLAYGVAQRQHEIGVRIALGAVPRQVMTMFLRRTMALVMPGLLIGVLSSVALTRVLSTFLFQIEPTDPATFASVVWLLALIALAAASVPARRASRVDPLVALRRD
jgi:ABC-type antimicrobial peptide transport system permease subunit